MATFGGAHGERGWHGDAMRFAEPVELAMLVLVDDQQI
jgi:hypothetical protein